MDAGCLVLLTCRCKHGLDRRRVRPTHRSPKVTHIHCHHTTTPQANRYKASRQGRSWWGMCVRGCGVTEVGGWGRALSSGRKRSSSLSIMSTTSGTLRFLLPWSSSSESHPKRTHSLTVVPLPLPLPSMGRHTVDDVPLLAVSIERTPHLAACDRTTPDSVTTHCRRHGGCNRATARLCRQQRLSESRTAMCLSEETSISSPCPSRTSIQRGRFCTPQAPRASVPKVHAVALRAVGNIAVKAKCANADVLAGHDEYRVRA